MKRKLVPPRALAARGVLINALDAQTQRISAGTRVDIRSDETIDVRDRTDGRVFTGPGAEDVAATDRSIAIPRGSPSRAYRSAHRSRSVDRSGLSNRLRAPLQRGHR